MHEEVKYKGETMRESMSFE